MGNYRISKVYLENFKLFDNAMIDFSDSDLIILDGPNGFGKTSIFDAIELVLTGQISRVSNNKTDAREGYKDILISKNPGQDTLIMVEFKSDQDCFTIVRKVNCRSVNSSTERNPVRLNSLLETYKLDEFNVSSRDFLSDNEISQDNLNALFDEDLQTFYNLYYYVEQEDRTRYLKLPEKDRMRILSVLFDTFIEDEELKKTRAAKSNVDRIVKHLDIAIQEQKALGEKIEQDLLTQRISEVPYENLLRWKQAKKEWDKEELDVKDSTKRSNYIRELNNIKSFLRFYEEYRNKLENREFEHYADSKQTKLLEHAIILYNHISSFEEIAKKHATQETYKQYMKVLEGKQLVKFDFKSASLMTGIVVNLEDIASKVELLSHYEKSASEISKLINELNRTRENLMKQFNSIRTNNGMIGNACPLCGHSWASYEDLQAQIITKTQYFKRFYDDSVSMSDQITEELYSSYASAIHSKIAAYLGNDNNLVDPVFFKQLNESAIDKDRVAQFAEWCRARSIDLARYTNKELKYLDNANDLTGKLREEILAKRLAISEDFRMLDADVNFDVVFADVFNNNGDYVRLLSEHKIDDKITYIDSCYFSNLKRQLDSIDRQISALLPKRLTLQKTSTQLGEITRIYDYQIKKHRSQIIKQIEIPFLIYSGRIMQDYQGGLGVLIKENETLDNVRFISSSKTDHDVLNTLSSGQLSALVLAFVLSLNKVYQRSKLDTILIDDPVQTMDDINMASFVELIRNEFENRQLIISTHEDEFSDYIRYKFLKYGLRSLHLNVKDKLNMPE